MVSKTVTAREAIVRFLKEHPNVEITLEDLTTRFDNIKPSTIREYMRDLVFKGEVPGLEALEKGKLWWVDEPESEKAEATVRQEAEAVAQEIAAKVLQNMNPADLMYIVGKTHKGAVILQDVNGVLYKAKEM